MDLLSSPTPASIAQSLVGTLPPIYAGVEDHSHHNITIVTGTQHSHHGPVINFNNAQTKISSHRRCPAPSTKYTRREDIEEHMDSYFFTEQSRKSRKRYVLHGLGGVGKTQASLAFTDRYFYSLNPGQRRFSQVFWIDATNVQTLTESLEGVARAAGLSPRYEEALEWLASREGDDAHWLMLFNNADNPELDMTKYFPDCSHGNILITTRNRQAGKIYGLGPGSEYSVGGMTVNEARDLLLQHARLEGTSPSVTEDVTELVKELDCIPLSITQAGAYILTTLSTPKEYLKMHRTHREQLMHDQSVIKNPDNYGYSSVQATWSISHSRLSPLSKELLGLCSRMHYDKISEMMFERMCSGLIEYETRYNELLMDDERSTIADLKKFREALLMDGRWNAKKCRQLISELQSYSLLSFDPESATWSIHPLVQEWAQEIRNNEERIAISQRAILLLGSITTLIECKSEEERAFMRALAPHVDQALKNADRVFDGCRNGFGFVYRCAARWDDEVAHREKYRQTCEKVLGPEHINTLASIGDLAATYNEQRRYEEAEALFTQVIEGRKRLLGEDHLDTLAAMADFAETCSNQWRFDEAEALELQVVEGRRKLLGDHHLDTLSAINALAGTYNLQRRYDEAAGLTLKVIEVQKEKLGADHLDTLSSIHHLATTYDSQRRFEEAATLKLQVIEVRKEQLGEDDLTTLDAIRSLALTYRYQGRLEEAEKLYVEVLHARRQKLGPDHLDVLSSIAELAIIPYTQKKFKEAEELYQQVIEGRKRKLGVDHIQTLDAIHGLALIYHHQERHDEAEPLYLEVVEGRKKKLGEDDLTTLYSLSQLAETYYYQERLDEAAAHQLQVVEGRKKKLGEDDPKTLDAIYSLALTYHDLQQHEKAVALHLQVVEGRKKKLGEDDPETLDAISSLARTYHCQRRIDEAATLELQVVEAQKKKLGEEHLSTLFSISELAITYHGQGRLEEAAALKRQVVDGRMRKLGEDDLETLDAIVSLAKTYQCLGRLSEAEALYLQALEGWKRQLESDHPDIQYAMENLQIIRLALQRRRSNIYARNRILGIVLFAALGAAYYIRATSGTLSLMWREKKQNYSYL